jgi:signal transduction histidine kinase
MEQQDLEEVVGNLLENAARFAATRVRVSATEAPEDIKGAEGSGRRHWVELVVEDDGPGLEQDQVREALKRGKRLDESKPGTGLGLSIVTEISNEYQGRLELSRGEWQGLKARLILPGITKDVA